MTRDDIMKLAKESYERGQSDLMESCKEAAVKAIASAILAEREACAKVCDAVAESANKAAVAGQYLIIRNGAEARRCSAAIRAQAADRLARHGIQIPEDEEYGNPSF